MGTALSEMNLQESEFHLYTAGPSKINSMVMEFSNISERSLKLRGIKIRFFKISPKWLKENIHEMNSFLYFSKPKETPSDIVEIAERKGLDVGLYRY
jgi:hypothetical protein